MGFPYGKAPLAILLLALLSAGGLLVASASRARQPRPDIIFATFTKEHAAAYRQVIPAFEKANNVSIQLQVVDQRALQQRLLSAFQVGAEVPDMVEIMDPTMGVFTKGPLEDVGFVDLTDLLHTSGLWEKLVVSRFGKYSSRGRAFALIHDVHPTMLCYRRDLIEDLGIDVSKLTTWDEFTRVGREISKIPPGKKTRDRYMIDLPTSEPWGLHCLLLQRGGDGGLFNEAGEVIFDSEAGVDVVCWYVKQVQGRDRISFQCGWGQTLAKSMIDGLCLFYICPDWRTNQFQLDVPSLAGKLAVMPMPAWTPGGRRTSTWGGTGLGITKQCKNFDLAWKLANYLYYDPEQLGPRFKETNILPPYIPAWTQPEFSEPRPFYSNQKLGQEYAALASQVPNDITSPYMQFAEGKLLEAFSNVQLYYGDGTQRSEEQLRDFARAELRRCADRVRRQIDRNVFLAQHREGDDGK